MQRINALGESPAVSKVQKSSTGSEAPDCRRMSKRKRDKAALRLLFHQILSASKYTDVHDSVVGALRQSKEFFDSISQIFDKRIDADIEKTREEFSEDQESSSFASEDLNLPQSLNASMFVGSFASCTRSLRRGGSFLIDGESNGKRISPANVTRKFAALGGETNDPMLIRDSPKDESSMLVLMKKRGLPCDK